MYNKTSYIVQSPPGALVREAIQLRGQITLHIEEVDVVVHRAERLWRSPEGGGCALRTGFRLPRQIHRHGRVETNRTEKTYHHHHLEFFFFNVT